MSEISSGWFLTHGDGTVHGPFTLADLVDAAGKGNIAAGTQLRHEVHTQGQWLPATRIRPVAEVLRKGLATARASEPTATPPHSPTPGDSPAPQAAPAPQVAPVATPSPDASPDVAAKQGSPATTGTHGPSPTSGQPAPSLEANLDAADGGPQSDVAVAVSGKRRSTGGRGHIVVPETIGAAILAVFDFRFRYFITPWIIRVTWAICVALAVITFVISTIGLVIRPLVSSAESEFQQSTVTGSSVSVAVQPGWQFRPPAWVGKNLGGIIAYGILVIGYAMSLLYLRMILELAIVLFRIANDLSDVRERLRES